MMTRQVEEDIEEMRAEERAQQAEASISMRELLCSPTLRAPLLIGVVMQLSQQLSGINAVTIATYLCSFNLVRPGAVNHVARFYYYFYT